MKKYIVLTIIMILLSVLLMGATSCSTSKTITPASGSVVNIVNFAFSPGTLTIKAGTTVTWTNNDSTTHNVASDSGVFSSGNLSPNSQFSYTFNSTGTFPYHCTIHTYMKGTIIVQ